LNISTSVVGGDPIIIQEPDANRLKGCENEVREYISPRVEEEEETRSKKNKSK